MFEPLSYLLGVVSGIVGLILIVAIFVPDEPARKAAAWLVTRKNVPTMLLPLAVPALVLGLIGFSIALTIAFRYVANVGLWIGLMLVGVLFVGLYWLVNHRSGAKPAAPPPPAAVQPPAEPPVPTPEPAPAAPAKPSKK